MKPTDLPNRSLAKIIDNMELRIKTMHESGCSYATFYEMDERFSAEIIAYFLANGWTVVERGFFIEIKW